MIYDSVQSTDLHTQVHQRTQKQSHHFRDVRIQKVNVHLVTDRPMHELK